MPDIVERALDCLGRGFDITSDFRMKYCKGKQRLVSLNEADTRDLLVPGFGLFPAVSVHIKCDKGERIRYQSDVLQFHQMSTLFNQKSSVPGKIPSGLFNAMFGFGSGSWAKDATDTKCLALDGYFISLFNVRIDRNSLSLCNQIRKDVPTTWQPPAIARFIETYGTHIIVGVSIGGQDVVFLRQDQSSNLQPSELKKHLDELGDQLFTGTCALSLTHCKTKEHKSKAPEAFNVFDQKLMLIDSCASVPITKDGITVICSKRGGDTTTGSHCEWLLTVPSMPDAINFNFIPITSLLKGVPGRGFLSHAINLYLRYKPPIADLECFLDFQFHKIIWAPIHSDLPFGPPTNKAIPTQPLQLNLMGPKLYVNTAQVTVGRRPVTGMRLFLEGNKCNRLAIHLQHLSNTPVLLENKTNEVLIWRGSDDSDDERYFEPLQWKKFSHVCTATVNYDPRWATTHDTTFMVAGAQLHVAKHDSKSVLHLRLLFAKVSNSGVCQSMWEQGSSGFSQKLSFLSTISTSLAGGLEKEKKMPNVIIDSGVFPTGPPVPVQTRKLLKFVDTSHVCKGAQDSPGHWLVTGAKLDLEKGKICLHVKFSLLKFAIS
ncbi:MACPF domain-containing protein [Cinnamomum micranthum f. kanehirae]|uniref:MACPF domain-containing protein n=1 Tax=Cinnamomum micranthum f. kanehirae TaxID=337451 RepID=A0A3S3P1F6_9MAGN|nr:MACPF domain-containing protein [Cinnamomum micranthum f. kanehirae]